MVVQFRVLIAFILVVFVAVGASSGAGETTSVAASTARVQAAVHDALAENATVSVLITLDTPLARDSRRIDVAALRSEVASVQAAVIASTTPEDFEIVYRYTAVPALAGKISAAGVETLARRSDVTTIEIDGEGSAATTESLPLIHADEVQATGLTGEGVVVAVLDSGIDTDHPDLVNSIAYEACFLSGGGCPGGAHPAEDDHGHGTNVSGIIAGKGIVAPIGVAPGVQIAAYKILRQTGGGFLSDWVAALDDIIANHPEVNFINMSLQSGNSCTGGGAMTVAISTLRQQGVATFIATGNHGSKNSFTIPACIEEGISVGAVYDSDIGAVGGLSSSCSDPVTAADQVACWSDSDDSIDLIAPGARITAPGLGGGQSTFIGTSQASPHAAGVAALLLEARPGLTVDEIEARMEATGTLVVDNLDDSDFGTNRTTPRIDARVAILVDSEDADSDGCTTGEELGTDAGLGGLRNPLNPWDFYDVDGNGTINVLGDVIAVANAWGPSSGERYDPALDRSPPPPGAFAWDMGPPDGMISIVDDVLAVIAQFGHTCADGA